MIISATDTITFYNYKVPHTCQMILALMNMSFKTVSPFFA